jgi:hypothetical protein
MTVKGRIYTQEKHLLEDGPTRSISRHDSGTTDYGRVQSVAGPFPVQPRIISSHNIQIRSEEHVGLTPCPTAALHSFLQGKPLGA